MYVDIVVNELNVKKNNFQCKLVIKNQNQQNTWIETAVKLYANK